ncbi:MAG: DNA polymerase III subunit chi [Pseudomonadota bacterium]|nr:DNA polymerase III subunit chi [Pseudomonadota bacterium]
MLVDFYHLDRSPLERVLPRICERLLESGERLLLVGEPALLQQLDELLWTYAPESFLPHGRSEAASPESQPILLSPTVNAVNGAANIALADGVWREEALAFARAFYFFDNSNLDIARGSWRALKDKISVDRRYWKQDEHGRWVQGP